MNIKEAAIQLRETMEAYLLKDEGERYAIPPEMQRPIMLIGPPGVGKSAIVAQIAREMGIGFVSYSITHHTRQTAIGLPYIIEREYGGVSYQVSRYTMSEIIASVYETIETTGVSEGVLFLDEVNCASETLAPAMLQFLQFKTFGQHRLPEGWVIVTSGNPPEYNHSAREFDAATLDRIKRIEVDADFDAWRSYALSHNVHPAVVGYLESKPNSFYCVHAGVRRSHLVTARGWEDLSRIIRAYERLDHDVDVNLVEQYLQDERIAEDFALYYRLFSRYRDDYGVPAILDGEMPPDIVARAEDASFTERMAVVGLLADAALSRVRDAMADEEALRLAREAIAASKEAINSSDDPIGAFDDVVAESREKNATLMQWPASKGDLHVVRSRRDSVFESLRRTLAEGLALQNGAGVQPAEEDGSRVPFEFLRTAFNERNAACGARCAGASDAVDAAILFSERSWGTGDEVAVLMTRLSADAVMLKFAGEHAGPAFLEHNEKLRLTDRTDELLKVAEALRAEGGTS